MAKLIGSSFLHSCDVRKLNNGGDAVVVSELQYFDDGTTAPHLRVVRNPKRSFYITKPQYRTHTEKRELDKIEHLDKYTVANSEMDREIFKALHGHYPNGYVNGRELMNNPYVYGADISIQTLIKARYKQEFANTKLTVQPSTTGFFDIERSIEEATKDMISLISVTHENQIYTAIHKDFFYRVENGCRVPGDVDELERFSHSILDPLVDGIVAGNKALKAKKTKLPFEVFYHVGETEMDMIRWIFGKIHENKTSFVGIWNMDYDIPNILKVLDENKIAHTEIFCPKDIPPEVRVAKYKPDLRQVDHYSLKWPWMHTTSYSQFYDAMCLYSRLRIVKGKESSYSLDHILHVNKMEGKLHFPELKDMENLSRAQWHIHMQRDHFYHYVVYNQADVLLLQLMEWQNNDAQAMVLLSDVTPLAKFSATTRRIVDTMFVDWLGRGMVIASPGSEMRTEHDADMTAVGGAVLSAGRMDRSGLRVIEEYPALVTQLHCFVNDVDFSSMYPKTTQAANVSKETKLSTALYITADHLQRYHTPKNAVEVFFGYLASPHDNAVRAGAEFFDLPNFSEMDQLFAQHVGKIDTDVVNNAQYIGA